MSKKPKFKVVAQVTDHVSFTVSARCREEAVVKASKRIERRNLKVVSLRVEPEESSS